MISIQHLKAAVFAAGLVTLALPALADPAKSGNIKRVDKEIQICVAAIGKRVKYGPASRVVHQVKEEEKNVAEQLYRISTTVYGQSAKPAISEYRSLCVTRGPIELVSLRIKAAPW